MLLAFITGQLAIAGQLGREVHPWSIRLLLGSGGWRWLEGRVLGGRGPWRWICLALGGCDRTGVLWQPLITKTNDLTTSKALSRLSSNEWGITRELDKELLLYLPLYICFCPGPCYNIILSPCFALMSYYSSTCVFHKATMLPTCALTSYL